MCSSLLDDLEGVRKELRKSKWNEEKDAGNSIIRLMFSSGGDQLKNIIETLNLLGMIVPEKSESVKDVAKDIVATQKNKGFLTLVDLRNCLAKVLADAETSKIDQMVENSKDLFGAGAESVRFKAADLSMLDGTFNMDFSSSLMLDPPAPRTDESFVNANPVATSSTTSNSDNREKVFAQMEASNPSFAAKLKKFRE